ncbi:MAG: hypothetical protein ACE5IJ_03745 [Thermoplasmata archaeon]
MLIPAHCREVGLKDVDFPLTSENIQESWRGKRIYFRTKFLVLKNGDDCSLLRIQSRPNGILNEIESIDILSLPEETVWVEDPNVDVLNPSGLVQAALRHSEKTVVVKGAFDHVSFVKDPETTSIRVFDVVPPRPPKLLSLVRKALDIQALDVPAVIDEDILDLSDLAKDVTTEEVLLPCEGRITSEKRVLHLSRSPEVKDATLLGCELSKQVAKELYGRDLPFIQMCPKRLVGQSEVPTIVKCCELQSGFEITGNVAVVPWGAREEDVVQALKCLLAEDRQR